MIKAPNAFINSILLGVLSIVIILSSSFSVIILGSSIPPLLTGKIQFMSNTILSELTSDNVTQHLGGNSTHVNHTINLFVNRIADTSSEQSMILVINELSTRIESNPKGPESTSILWHAKQLSFGNVEEVNEILLGISPPPEEAIDNLVNDAINRMTGMVNAKFHISQITNNVFEGNKAPTGIAHGVSYNSLGFTSPQDSLTGESIQYILYQIILQTGYQYEPDIVGDSVPIISLPAATALTNIAAAVDREPRGPISQAISSIAQLYREGYIDLSNQAVLSIANHLANWGNVIDIPNIVNNSVNQGQFQSRGIQVDISVKDPIYVGEEQTIMVIVSDSESGRVISGARINGEVRGPSGSEFVRSVNRNTDLAGGISPPWHIEEALAPGVYTVLVEASAPGYQTGSEVQTFSVRVPSSVFDDDSDDESDEDSDEGSGLRVFVHNGEGQICVNADNENAGCKYADDDGNRLEFEFSPGAVDVGERFRVCDNGECSTHENGPEEAPEHVYLHQPSPQGVLNVKVQIVCADGALLCLSYDQITNTITGNNPNPETFSTNIGGQDVSLGPGEYGVESNTGGTGGETVEVLYSEGCSGVMTLGDEINCVVTWEFGSENGATPPEPCPLEGQVRNPETGLCEPEGPDQSCLFEPSLSHCAAIDGDCPEGFNMNEDGQCFPQGGCPVGYHRVEDDESGKCYSDDIPCPEDQVKSEEGNCVETPSDGSSGGAAQAAQAAQSNEEPCQLEGQVRNPETELCESKDQAGAASAAQEAAAAAAQEATQEAAPPAAVP